MSPVLSVLLSRREREAGRLSDGFTVSHTYVQMGQDPDPERAGPSGAGCPAPGNTLPAGSLVPWPWLPFPTPTLVRRPWRSLLQEAAALSRPQCVGSCLPTSHGSRLWGPEPRLGTSGGPSLWLCEAFAKGPPLWDCFLLGKKG